MYILYMANLPTNSYTAPIFPRIVVKITTIFYEKALEIRSWVVYNA